MARIADPPFASRVASALPRDVRFTVHYIVSPPSHCQAIFSAPPSQEAEPTRCQPHFLSISISYEGRLLQVFALEVLIYTSDGLTTVFISKADSTGYLHLLNLPKGSESPLRTLTSQFLSCLIEKNKRHGIRLVVSLFARAQDQYLFPGSIENSSKHVLDDRGLIKWWCSILDTVLREYPANSYANLAWHERPTTLPGHDASVSSQGFFSHGYLIVPGCDVHETRSFFPKAPQSDPQPSRWSPNDPLRSLGKPPTLPERCLIPRFPDDPKARFLIDLDDELPENGPQPQNSPAKNSHPGKWRSVRTLAEFWEMMAFRQECAAGRLVGFIWGVFTPGDLLGRPFDAKADALDSDEPKSEVRNENSLLTPTQLQVQKQDSSLVLSIQEDEQPQVELAIANPSQQDSQASQLPTPLSSSQVEPGTQDSISVGSYAVAPTVPSALGDVISLPSEAYSRILALLMTLDYSTAALASTSTHTFVKAIATEAGLEGCGFEVAGQKDHSSSQTTNSDASTGKVSDRMNTNGEVATLGQGLVRRKKRPADEGVVDNASKIDGPTSGNGILDKAPEAVGLGEPSITVLPTGLVRKKAKVREV